MKTVDRMCTLLLVAILASCGEGRPSWSAPHEAIDAANAPDDLVGAGPMERRLAVLPAQGQTGPVWTGDYWPDSQGGTARRKQTGVMSPMEKYDAATNGQNQATNWERQEATRNGGHAWAGHCNGLTAAGIRTKEPQRAVQYRGVEFSVEDIKALLTEAYMDNGRLVGRRCNRSSMGLDPMGRPTEAACRDLNPGSLHLALTNFIGAHRQPLIIDRQASEEVWNYIVTGYQSSVRQIGREEALSLVFANPGRPYPFNAQVAAFAVVDTELELLLVSPARESLRYLLELDDQGEIIGGEWLADSRLRHPDFVWRPERQPKPLNPYLDLGVIREIYQGSIN